MQLNSLFSVLPVDPFIHDYRYNGYNGDKPFTIHVYQNISIQKINIFYDETQNEFDEAEYGECFSFLSVRNSR